MIELQTKYLKKLFFINFYFIYKQKSINSSKDLEYTNQLFSHVLKKSRNIFLKYRYIKRSLYIFNQSTSKIFKDNQKNFG